MEKFLNKFTTGATGTAVHERTADDPPTDQIRAFWRSALGVSEWLGEDVFEGLYTQFVQRVAVSESTLAAIRSRPVIYLANHQVAVESLVFVIALAAISGIHIRALAKESHQNTWIGELLGMLYDYPGLRPPPPIYYRDEYNPQSLVDILAEMRRSLTEDGHSLLIHAEGARMLSCRRPITRLSAVFFDIARETGMYIIPVNFAGGLPVDPMDNYRDFPINFSRQTFHLGEPIEAEAINALHPRDRRQMIVDAINAAGPGFDAAEPAPPNPAFLEDVQNLLHETATTQVKAVMVTVLRNLANPTEQTLRVLRAVAGEMLVLSQTPQDDWLGRFCKWLTDGRGQIVTGLGSSRPSRVPSKS